MKKNLYSRSKLIVLLSLILLFAFTFTSLLSYSITRQLINTNARTKTLPLVSDNIYSEIQQELITPINNSSLMANDEFLIKWVIDGEQDTNEISRYLNRIKEKYGYSSAFFISAKTLNYYYYDGILKQVDPDDPHDVWFYDFLKLNTRYDLDVDTDEAADGSMTVFINHRLEDHEGTFLGVTGVGLQMNSIGGTLATYRDRYGQIIYMIDASGLIQVHPDPTMVETVNIKNLEGISAISAEILTEKEGTHIYEFKHDQKDVVISTRYFADFDWFLIVEQDQSQSLTPARQYLIGNIAIGIFVTILVIVIVAFTINIFHKQLENLATNDDLTGLYNRRKFQELYEHEASYAKRYDQSITLLMIDADHFKSINDQYGHNAGDRMLIRISEILNRGIRDIDVIARWGGEEFVILLHKLNAECAFIVAERLRKAVSETEITTSKGSVHSTISIGIASSSPNEVTFEDLLKLADQAMYRAKAEGRNRTCIAKNLIDD